MIIGLTFILLLVLLLPFLFHRIERNLELFLFVMGITAAMIAGVLHPALLRGALIHPLPITVTVFAMGLLFKLTRVRIEQAVTRLRTRMPDHLFIFLMILLLGLLSSIITVIIASLVLVEIVALLRLQRKAEVRVVILACYALGLGAVLTPIGEPLSTIATLRLAGEPYHAGFWFLMRELGLWIVPGVLLFAALSLFFREPHIAAGPTPGAEPPVVRALAETYFEVALRAAKVYLFVMALVFLGEAFRVMVDRYVIHLPSLVLYWINIISAVLDNATLAAAEISPAMHIGQIRDILLGLLIAGGMLIPGNIPNIIAAGKLKIGSREWARFALPVGFAAMLVCFVFLLVLPGPEPQPPDSMQAEAPASLPAEAGTQVMPAPHSAATGAHVPP